MASLLCLSVETPVYGFISTSTTATKTPLPMKPFMSIEGMSLTPKFESSCGVSEVAQMTISMTENFNWFPGVPIGVYTSTAWAQNF
jgi:hypothetical protein